MADSAQQAWIQAVVDSYQAKLIQYARGITGNLESARDVTQDTFMKLCVQDRAQLNGKLAPWLYTVCRNRALDVRKKEGRMNAMEPVMVDARPGKIPAPNVVAIRNEHHAALIAAVNRLPETEQEMFRLKFEHSLTYRQIAAVTDTPLSTVSYTLTRAIKTLREEMKDHLNPETAGRLKEANHE